MSDTDVYKVIRLQALVRGYQERKRFLSFQRDMVKDNAADYFNEKEFYETLQ